MDFDVTSVRSCDWAELATSLRAEGYSTQRFKTLLGFSDSASEILKNIGRYSFLCLEELSGREGAFSVLVRLFMLCGRVRTDEFEALDGSLKDLLRRTGLVVPVATVSDLVRATVTITELAGSLILSDRLFENTGTEFLLRVDEDICMPPHASSLELLSSLCRPVGADSFLDVGCGSGCQSLLFAADYGRIVGFDPGPRQVAFARANAEMNAVVATYAVDTWQTFAADQRFDHVVFNTPTAESAFAFINAGLDRVLSGPGRGQVWLVGELSARERDWDDHVMRRLALPGRWTIRATIHRDSPFSISGQSIAERRPPPGALLVDPSADVHTYLEDLRRRGVAEVSSLTLTIDRATGGAASSRGAHLGS